MIVHVNKKIHNRNWPQIPNHPFKVVIAQDQFS